MNEQEDLANDEILFTISVDKNGNIVKVKDNNGKEIF